MKENVIEKEIEFIKSNFYTLYNWIESLQSFSQNFEKELKKLKNVVDSLEKKEEDLKKEKSGRRRKSSVHKLS